MSNVPLPAGDRRVLASPGAGATNLAFDFGIRDEEDLLVARRRGSRVDVLGLNTDYVVIITGPASGAIVLSAPTIAGDIVAMDGRSPEERISDFLAGHGFSTDKLNADLDYITQILQEHRRDIDDGLTFPPGVSGSRRLPAPQNGRGLVWNAETGSFENGLTVAELLTLIGTGGFVAYTKTETDLLLAGKSPLGHQHVIGDVAGLTNALAGKQNALPSMPEFAANKGQAGGYAGLDGTGKVPAAQLPAAQTVDAYTKAQTDALVGARQLTSQKGQANGYAALDGDGKVPVSQLPAAPGGSSDAKDIIFYPTPSIAVPVAQRLGQEVVLTDGYTSGLTDFSDLFQANLERARDSGRPLRIPGGRFTVSRRFTLTTDKPVTITGDGKLLSQLLWPTGSVSDGLQFIATVDKAGGLFEDFGLVTQLDCVSTALGFNLAQQAAPIGGAGDTVIVDRMRPRCDVRSLYIAGDDNVDAYGFLNGFTSEMALQVRVTDSTFVGRRLDQFNYKSNRAFNLGTATNKGHPVESYIDRCAVYYAQSAYRFEGMEGMFARGNHAVYVGYGYTAVDATGRPHFECVGNHANFSTRGVTVDGVREARVDGNSLYHLGNQAAVAVAVGGPNCQNAQINDNFIVNAINSTGQLSAIDIYNCEHGKIDGNQIVSQVSGYGTPGKGITLAGQAKYMTVGANNIFPNPASGRAALTSNIIDAGQSNVVGSYVGGSGSSSAGQGARYRKSGDQAVSAGSLNIISFQNQEDVLGPMPDMSGGVFTVPYAGLWSFHANVQTSGQGGAATTIVNMQYNASSGNAIAGVRAVTADNEIVSVSIDTGPRRCAAGDEIRVGINTSIARSVLAVVNTSFEARRIA